jgi:hypothetical protein
MVIQEAWIGGVSTRRVDELVQAMGLTGISKNQVPKLCKDIDERVNAFPDRRNAMLGTVAPLQCLPRARPSSAADGRELRGDRRCRAGLKRRGAEWPAGEPMGRPVVGPAREAKMGTLGPSD